jgi:hypothetical protein
MPKFITLTCPSCGGQMTVAPGTSRFTCDYCGNEHILKNDPSLPPVSERVLVPRPQSLTIEKEGRAIRFSRRWFSLKYIPLAFFCVAWDAFLLFWYGMAFRINGPWIMFVFPIAHLAVGIGLTYTTLAGFFNRTVLEVTAEEINVWHEPLPWSGEPRIQTADLQQLYCRDHRKHSSDGDTVSYELLAVTRDGHSVKLVSGLDSPDVALYLEQQLERGLRIADRPVAGELSR